VTGVSGVSESVVSESVSESMVADSDGSVDHWPDGRVVDQRGGGGDDPGTAGKDGRVGLTLLPLLGSGLSSGSNGGKMSSSGSGNLGGQLGGNEGLGVEGGGNKRLRVEGGSNQRLGVEGGGNGKARVSDTESSSVSDVLNLLENSGGVDVRVSSLDSSVGVSDLLLGRVQVGVAVVQVAELILSVELAASVGRGSVGSHVGGGNGRSVSSSVAGNGNSVDGVGKDCGASNGGCHEGRDCDLKI